MQIVLPELYPEEGQVEGADETGQLVPGYSFVEEFEGADTNALYQGGLEVGWDWFLILVGLLLNVRRGVSTI
jgi:hypothetical protein